VTTTEENDLMCRVGPGSPMGAMLAEYWWPVLRSQKLEADGAPERVRLLGRDYVAFRASDGRLGFFDEGCPHRSASLVLARNEDCGLRCLLHGWKIDVSGQVVDTPNEFGFSRPERIKVHHYPIQEAGGMVWVYVGGGEPPAFPNLAFNQVPAGTHVLPVVAKFRCNWVQLMETLWDPAHVQILHGTGQSMVKAWEGTDAIMGAESRDVDTPPLAMGECETQMTPFGFMYKFGRGPDGPMGGTPSWVPTVMPCWIFIAALGGTPDSDRIVFGHVPVDDDHTLLWQIAYNTTQPLSIIGQTLVKSANDPDDWRPPEMDRENNWGQDRAAMEAGSFTGIGEGQGITGLLIQDVAMAESMGPIVDRNNENLGPADLAIVRGRRMLLDAVRAHMKGERALGVDEDVTDVGTPGGRQDGVREPAGV